MVRNIIAQTEVAYLTYPISNRVFIHVSTGWLDFFHQQYGNVSKFQIQWLPTDMAHPGEDASGSVFNDDDHGHGDDHPSLVFSKHSL